MFDNNHGAFHPKGCVKYQRKIQNGKTLNE